jgi:hypothetical protein
MGECYENTIFILGGADGHWHGRLRGVPNEVRELAESISEGYL